MGVVVYSSSDCSSVSQKSLTDAEYDAEIVDVIICHLNNTHSAAQKVIHFDFC